MAALAPLRSRAGPRAKAALDGALAAALGLRRDTFTLGGETHRYVAHPYNETWRNERGVELAVATALLDARPGARVLEVGNVLAHYGRHGHTVVDKYERAPGVIAADVLDHAPPAPYDVIVTLSTLEHVGFEEETPDPDKPRRAVEHLAGMLAPGGLLLVTFPLGYNRGLDGAVRDGRVRFDELRFLRRASRLTWREVPAEATYDAAYGSPYPKGNTVAVGLRRG